MDKDPAGANIQDHYLGRARKDRAFITVVLNGGQKIRGRIVSFDRYTVILEDHGQEQMVFKHAIATITTARTFANAIQFDKSKEGRDRPAGKDPAGAIAGAAGKPGPDRPASAPPGRDGAPPESSGAD